MVASSMSRGKKAYLQYGPQLSAVIARLTPLREELKASVDVDAEAWHSVAERRPTKAKPALPAARNRARL